ncbi:MAG: hypothetical protein M3O46_16325, partial [Myxococcota bacterium]|nr:hypothetical protein [Myxococcota bacterium]
MATSGADGNAPANGADDGAVGVGDGGFPVTGNSDGSIVTGMPDTGGPSDGSTPDTASPSPVDGGVGWDTVPSILARIVAPTFPNLDCIIT